MDLWIGRQITTAVGEGGELGLVESASPRALRQRARRRAVPRGPSATARAWTASRKELQNASMSRRWSGSRTVHPARPAVQQAIGEIGVERYREARWSSSSRAPASEHVVGVAPDRCRRQHVGARTVHLRGEHTSIFRVRAGAAGHAVLRVQQRQVGRLRPARASARRPPRCARARAPRSRRARDAVPQRHRRAGGGVPAKTFTTRGGASPESTLQQSRTRVVEMQGTATGASPCAPAARTGVGAAGAQLPQAAAQSAQVVAHRGIGAPDPRRSRSGLAAVCGLESPRRAPRRRRSGRPGPVPSISSFMPVSSVTIAGTPAASASAGG